MRVSNLTTQQVGVLKFHFADMMVEHLTRYRGDSPRREQMKQYWLAAFEYAKDHKQDNRPVSVAVW